MTVKLLAHARTENLHTSGRQKAKPVLRTQNETNKKATAVPGGKGSLTNGYPKTKFIGNLIWKGRDNVKFDLPLLTGHYRLRLGRADSCKNSHPSLVSSSFLSISSIGSRVSGVSQWVLSELPKTVRVEK